MSVGVYRSEGEEPETGPPVFHPDPELAAMGDEEFAVLADRVQQEALRRRIQADAVVQAESAVRNWRAASGRAEGEEWVQPTGAHDAYPEGWHVVHDGRDWLSTTPNNVWEPGVSGWRERVSDGDGGEDSGTYPEWIQPTGAHDAYDLDDRVTYDGRVWRSTTDENVWEPGVYGWEAEDE